MASKKEWQKKALKKAGIDPTKWVPKEGWVHNKEIIKRVYAFYTSIFEKDNCKFMWAGLAKMAGGPVYGGLFKAALLRLFAIGRDNKRAARNLRKFKTILMEMNKAIFMDLAWQHVAYMEGGIKEMKARLKAGEIDETTYKAWVLIDSGKEKDICKGNEMLLRREQEVILKDGYEKLAKFAPGEFKEGQWARLMSRLVKSPLPGGKKMQEVIGLKGNLTVFEHRWEWIMTDMWPRWKNIPCQERVRLAKRSLKKLSVQNFGEPTEENKKKMKKGRKDKAVKKKSKKSKK